MTRPTVQTVGTNTLFTQLGTFNPVPAPGRRIIPINNYTGRNQFSFNLRI